MAVLAIFVPIAVNPRLSHHRKMMRKHDSAATTGGPVGPLSGARVFIVDSPEIGLLGPPDASGVIAVRSNHKLINLATIVRPFC
jgi:hypothetical protein